MAMQLAAGRAKMHPAWRYVSIVTEGKNDSETLSECKICGNQAKGGATRWASHLLGRAVGTES